MAVRCVISNHYGEWPNEEMCEFCGNEVIAELMKKDFKGLENDKKAVTCRVSFTKDGRCYHALKFKPKNDDSGYGFHCYVHLRNGRQ